MQKRVQVDSLSQTKKKNAVAKTATTYPKFTSASLPSEAPTFKLKKLITRIVFLSKPRFPTGRQNPALNFQTAGCFMQKKHCGPDFSGPRKQLKTTEYFLNYSARQSARIITCASSIGLSKVAPGRSINFADATGSPANIS